MATEIRPGYRYEAPNMVGRVPAAREKSRPIVLLGLCIRGKLQDKVSYNQDAEIDEPFAPRVLVLWGCILEDLVHRPYHFCLHLKKSLVPVMQRHTVSS